MARDQKSLQDTLLELDREANIRGLTINENRTKYITTTSVHATSQ